MKIEIDLKNTLGTIEPVGQTEVDEERYNNIEIYDNIIRFTLEEMIKSARYKNSFKHSEQKIGQNCFCMLKDIQEMINGEVRSIEESEEKYNFNVSKS